MVGTLEYMAPECLLKEPGSPASDVYAWAVTVNELATGTFPFSDCTRDNPKAHTVLEMGYGRYAAADPTPCCVPPTTRSSSFDHMHI
jgi:serine/threonine protein kinase